MGGKFIIFGSGSEWFWAMIQTFVVAVSLIFIYRQVKYQSEQISLEIFNEFRQRWNSQELLNARLYICEVATEKSSSLEIASNEGVVLDFMNELGLFQEKGLLSKRDIWKVYGYYIEHYWQILNENVKQFRITDGHNYLYEDAENLYNMSIKISKKNKKYSAISVELLDKFLYGEMKEILSKIDNT